MAPQTRQHGRTIGLGLFRGAIVFDRDPVVVEWPHGRAFRPAANAVAARAGPVPARPLHRHADRIAVALAWPETSGMSLKSVIVAQFGKPSGLLGSLAGRIMARRPSNRFRNARTVELLQLAPDSRVLEIGCGPGLALAGCARIVTAGRIVGLDHSAMMIRQARARLARMALKRGRLERLRPSLKWSVTEAWTEPKLRRGQHAAAAGDQLPAVANKTGYGPAELGHVCAPPRTRWRRWALTSGRPPSASW